MPEALAYALLTHYMETSLATQPLVTLEQLKLSRTFDFNLEALRGVAAIVVVWHHVILHQHWLDPHYIPSGLFAFVPSGHLSVLVFFVLSGYVIGRVHLVPLGKKDIVPYLKKRFIRIYPIYLVSMILALLVARQNYTALTVISNLTMTQNELAPIIFENNPSWSLGFEIAFYLSFVPLSFFRINVPITAGIFAVIGIIANTQQYWGTGGYFLGFAFWLCGVMIARNAQRSLAPSFALMVSLLLLLLSLREFNSLTVWLYKIHVLLANPDTFEAGPAQIADLSNLPYCLLLVLVFASRDFIYRKWLVLVLLLLPIYGLRTKLYHMHISENKFIILPICFYALSLLIYFNQQRFENVCERVIHRISSTGALSYGLYIMHFPIIAIFVRIEWFSGTAITFCIRLLCYIFLCFTASYFLEKKFQPWVKRVFY